MDKDLEEQIKAFVKERDEMLLTNDIDKMLEFHKKHNPHIPPPSSREVAEISLHKARTAARSLPIEERRKSKYWLTARGYNSLDEGDL